MMRERKKGVRKVVQKCMLAAEGGVITTQSSESVSLSQLVLLCLQSLEDSIKSDENYSQTMRLEKSNKNGSNNKNNHDNHDNYRDDNHDNGDNNGYYDHEDISSNQSGLNHMENSSKNINRYHDNYDDNDKKKEYHTTAREQQLCDERNHIARLAEKLLEHPETYLAVLDILGNVRYCTCTSS